jgi:hypothetical protein
LILLLLLLLKLHLTLGLGSLERGLDVPDEVVHATLG